MPRHTFVEHVRGGERCRIFRLQILWSICLIFRLHGTVFAEGPWDPSAEEETVHPYYDHEAERERSSGEVVNEFLDLGLSAIELHDWQAAAFAFEQALTLKPDHDRARLELARTYYAMGDLRRSQQEFEHVSEHHPPVAVQRNIDRFLSAIRAGTKRWATHLHFSTGIFYDDNVNVGPDSDRIRVSPIVLGDMVFDALHVAEESRPAESAGLLLDIGARVDFDVGVPAGWRLGGELEHYQTWLDKADAFDLRYEKFKVDASYLTHRLQLTLPMFVEHIDQGGEVLLNMYGVRPSIRVATTPRRTWETILELHYRDYEQVSDRDSVYSELREEVLQQFGGAATHLAKTALSVFVEEADASVYTRYGVHVEVGAEFQLPLGLSSYVSLQYRFDQYDEREPLAPKRRRDHEGQLAVGLSKPLGTHLRVDLGYQYLHHTSRFDLYEYQRNVAVLTVTGTY